MLKRKDNRFDSRDGNTVMKRREETYCFDIRDQNPMLKRKDRLFDNFGWKYYDEKKGRDKCFDI